MEDARSLEGQSQQRCEGQKRPGTPDHAGEKGSLSTLGGLQEDYREALQIYEKTKATRSFFVELGVGWTIDPTYAVGKKMTVFCPVEEEWHHCTTRSYCEENGIHEIQFDDGKVIQLPLLGVKARFLVTGGSFPQAPSLSRKKQIVDTISKGIESGSYKKGFLPGIQRGLERLQESMVHDASYIKEHGDQGEELEMALSILVGKEKIINKYKMLRPKYLAMPHWMEARDHSPGDLVWVKFPSCQDWPCLVVSPDQILPEGRECNITDKHKHVCLYFLGTYEHAACKNNNVVSFAEGLYRGYHKAEPKRYKKTFKTGLMEAKIYAKVRLFFAILTNLDKGYLCTFFLFQDGLIPSMLLEIFNKVNIDDQLNKIPLRKRKADHSLSSSKFRFNSNLLLSNLGYNQGSTNSSNSSQWEGSTDMNTGLSVKGFRVLNLGVIEWKNPNYHSKEYIWPAGYKIQRTTKSKYSEKKAIPHVVEIKPAIDRVSEPVFKLTVSGSVRSESKGSSEMFKTFFKSLKQSKKCDNFYTDAGVKFLGLNKPPVFKAILNLPNANKCAKLASSIKKKIPLARVSKKMLDHTDPLLEEMRTCQLPEGIKPVPMLSGRPFECQICGDIEEDDEDFILQCDKCKNCAHMSCYSVPEAPHGRLWLCDVCQSHPKEEERPACILCPVQGGIMKRTTCGKWCHPICALWLPETSLLRDQQHMHLRGLVGGINLIHKSRMTSLCMFCKQKYGAVIQCCEQNTDCFRAFHFMCAKGKHCSHELVMDADENDSTLEQDLDPESGQAQPPKKKKKKGGNKTEKKGTSVGNGGRLKVYCPKHSSRDNVSRMNASSNLDSNSSVEIESYRFSSKNVADWLEKRKHMKKTYVQALALNLGASVPMTTAEQRRAVPTGPSYKCTNLADGLHSEVSQKNGVTTTSASLVGQQENRILSVSENYNRLVHTWKKVVFPGKSAIHGWGAFSTKKISRGDMVIEYVGELVRPSVAEMRERLLYDKLVGAGTYVFRLNADLCVDATRSGNLAHLLNHACSPNCASRTITVKQANGGTVDYVIIFALRDIEAGEELTYDYRFCGEEILYCSCGSTECRGMVNQNVPEWTEPCWAPASMVKPVNFDDLA